MQTDAAVLFELDEPLKIVKVDIPALKAGQVLIEIVFSGVCHTQLLEARGRRGVDRFLPHLLGHEAAGIVTETGEKVTKVSAGDHVVLSWIKGSGMDIPSAAYMYGDTKINSGAITTFSRYSVVSENRLTVIDKSMPFKEASLLGCAVCTGIGSVVNTAQIPSGKSVAVFGAGGIGLAAIMGANLVNAAPVIAVDIHERKLELAKELGATHCVNAAMCDPVELIKEITGGLGVDYCIEAAGLPETMEQGFESICNRTGILVVVGNAVSGSKMKIDPHGLNMGKKIIGTWGGDTAPDRDIPLYVDQFLSGKLKLDKMISHSFSLDDINTSLECLEGRDAGRILIDMRN